jgi:proteasome alpha subunit
MSNPSFYVSPEQLMQDRAEYARKGIARGRSVVVLSVADGVLFVGENPSRALHKVGEIYDRIAYAAVGKYNEFDSLRIAGIRLADTRGAMYHRQDVTALGLVGAYAQVLGTSFSDAGSKPYEVEVVVAEVGGTVADDQLYRLTYDGSVLDEHGVVVIGGAADAVRGRLRDRYDAAAGVADAVQAAVEALRQGDGDEPREIAPEQLEVAILDRNRRQQRKFRRLTPAQIASTP